MGGVVYLLCAATALACGALLMRGYFRGRTRLLLWCSIFFLSLAAENVILFFDRVVLGEDIKLILVRRTVALIGSLTLVYGLVWEGISAGGREGTGWAK